MSEIKIAKIPIRQISGNLQPRQAVGQEAIEQMAQSLASIGQLSPVGIERSGDSFVLRFGNTRFLAAQKLGWESILARVFPSEEYAGDALQMAVVENTVRDQMTFIELADVIHEYAGLKQISLSQAGSELGFKQPLVSKCLKIEQRLTPANKKRLVDAGVGGSLAYLLSQETDQVAQNELIDTAIKQSWTRTDIERHFREKRKPTTKLEYAYQTAKAVLELPKGASVELILEMLKEMSSELRKLAAISSTPETIARVLKEQKNAS